MGLRAWLEKVFTAITFAEANDHKTAREIMKAEERRKKAEKKLLKRRRLRPPNSR